MNEVIDNLKNLVKSSNKIVKLLNIYTKIKGNSVDNAYVLEKKLGEIERFIPGLPDFDLKGKLNVWIKEEKEKIETFKEDFRFKFGQELAALFSKEGKKITGQYPTLRIGFYTIKLDFQFGEATLYFGPEIEQIKSKIPLEPKTIFETIKKYDGDLRAIKSTPEEIFKDLCEAYSRRLKLTNKKFGEKLLITEVLNEFVMLKQSERFFIDPQKSNFREYSRIKLIFLLYLLKKSNFPVKKMGLHVATFDATVNKIHSIWVPENEDGEGTHYSHISFEKVQNA